MANFHSNEMVIAASPYGMLRAWRAMACHFGGNAGELAAVEVLQRQWEDAGGGVKEGA